MVGDAVAGGADSVWFSAGPNDEQHGLVGLLMAAPVKHHHQHHRHHHHHHHGR
jgi:hypothetical protein